MRSGLVRRDNTLEKYKFTSGNRGSDLESWSIQSVLMIRPARWDLWA